MKSEKARQVILRFMTEISYDSINAFEEKYGEIITELSEKISKLFSGYPMITEYLDFVLREIDDLNSFFKSNGSGKKIPYYNLISFANKDDRISKFLFEKGAEKKLSKERSRDVDVAGYEFDDENEDSIVLIHDNDVYGCVYVTSKRSFLFSSANNKLIVQNSKGKIISYKKYLSLLKNKRHITLKKIYNEIIKNKSNTFSMKAFKEFYESNFS